MRFFRKGGTHLLRLEGVIIKVTSLVCVWVEAPPRVIHGAQFVGIWFPVDRKDVGGLFASLSDERGVSAEAGIIIEIK